MTLFLAHTKLDDSGNRIDQTCQDHCDHTAIYAQNSLLSVGLGSTAFLAGVMHDFGKFTLAFQKYLDDATNGLKARRGSVNHTFAGVRYILEKFHSNLDNPIELLTSEIIAYAIGAHHGLFDCVNEDHKNGFDHRQNKEGISYHEAMDNFFSIYCSTSDIEKLFYKSANEIDTILSVLDELFDNYQSQDDNDRNQEYFFYLGLLARLVLSAVVEGDRRDTSEFYAGKPQFEILATRDLWNDTLTQVEKQLALLPCQTEIEKARSLLSGMCRDSSLKESGIYRLNLPTGAGKTLSSLRFALAHAKEHEKKRIIFVTPLLSILDQNAAEIRKFVNNDAIILEHHSNIIHPTESTEEYDKWEYYTETWHSPIIITTMVQFLNTLFSGKMSSVRRLHALCESIIVIDEVQTVPVKMLSLFNSAMNFLQTVCKATIVLSSATQPTFEGNRFPLKNISGDIVCCGKEIRELFRRTTISSLDSCSLEDTPALVQTLLNGCNSLLIVCNKKNEASYLFDHICIDGCEKFHLSASMCIQHRRDILNEMKTALEEIKNSNAANSLASRKVICISTQVIEAGVHISFERAIRFCAGMDSVVQTAGRCNRNGESKNAGDVYILSCLDENLNRLKEIKASKMATESLLTEFKKNSSKFQENLDSEESIKHYYKQYFNSFGIGYQEYCLPNKETLYNLLSSNEQYSGHREENQLYYFKQAFSSAGLEFKVFDTENTDVIVPYKEGIQIINDLNSEKARWNDHIVSDALEKAKQYTVSLYSYQLNKLEKLGALYKILDDKATVLQPQFYDDYIGVIDEDKNYGYLEVSI